MIDIKLIRENQEQYKKAAKEKHFNVNIDRLVELDEALRGSKAFLQSITTQKNRIGKSIPSLSESFLSSSSGR